MYDYAAVMGSKGGVGKSTVAKAIYLEWTRQGKRVNVMDGDPQQHLQGFADNHKKHDEYDHTIIDTAGIWSQSNEQLIQQMAKNNGLIIVLFQPSDDDLKETVMMTRRLEKGGVLDKAVFTVNCTYRDLDNESKGYCKKLIELGLEINLNLNVCKYGFQRLNEIKYAQNKGKGRQQTSRFMHEVGLI